MTFYVLKKDIKLWLLNQGASKKHRGKKLMIEMMHIIFLNNISPKYCFL